MQRLEYEFGPYASAAPATTSLVGVVGSGNMEALFERQALGGMIRFRIDTSIAGFDATWRAVLGDFAELHGVGDLLVSINDAGATPSVVALRLAQAAEELGI
jgi:malonate decarboxylase delta subunit